MDSVDILQTGCIGNKHFTPKTAFYKALTTDYLDINCELKPHVYIFVIQHT